MKIIMLTSAYIAAISTFIVESRKGDQLDARTKWIFGLLLIVTLYQALRFIWSTDWPVMTDLIKWALHKPAAAITDWFKNESQG